MFDCTPPHQRGGGYLAFVRRQELVGDVKVGEDVLHIIVVVNRVHQSEDLGGVGLFGHRDGVLWNESEVGRHNFQTEAFKGVANGPQFGGFSGQFSCFMCY